LTANIDLPLNHVQVCSTNWSKLGGMMILNQEVKKWATDLHIFLHKAEMFLPSSNSAEEFVGKVFSNFEEKPQFLSNEEAEEMLHELWLAYKDGRLD
jgi:hypothetical protein